jgi:hypothetical protein
MKNSNHLNRMDIIFILSAGIFFFSCIFTTLQTAHTKAPGQAELSAGYLQARSIDEFSESPVQLMGLDARIGVARNFDVGIEHTFDLSKDNEGAFKTFWGDAKYQFTNHGNELNMLTFSSGLIKGYAYDENAQVHITTLPLYFSLPVNNRLIPTFSYRYDLLSDDFFPNSDSFDDPRHTFTLGIEYAFKEPDPTKWIPKFAFSIGTLQSFKDDSDSGIFLFNFGFKFDTPYKAKQPTSEGSMK